MDEKQFERFMEDNRRSTAEAIEKTVNGKILRLTQLVLDGQKAQDDKMTDHMVKHAETDSKVEAFISKSEPYITSWESAIKTGNNIKWLAVFIASVGGAYLVLKHSVIAMVKQ